MAVSGGDEVVHVSMDQCGRAVRTYVGGDVVVVLG